MIIKIMSFWALYVAIFTIIPYLLIISLGNHSSFHSLDNNLALHVIAALAIVLGGVFPFVSKLKSIQLKNCFKITIQFRTLLILLFCLTHILIYSAHGTNFRHHIRISEMGLLGYAYALEQVALIPLTILQLRLANHGYRPSLLKDKLLLLSYGVILVTLSFNVFNLVCGFFLIILCLIPRLVDLKVNVISGIFLIFGIVTCASLAVFLIKGIGFESPTRLLRYLQYRISIWYVSFDLLASMDWSERFLLFRESLIDENSINTYNANVIFNVQFVNARVGAGPGIAGASLYLVPLPFCYFLIALYSCILSYLIKCSELFKRDSIFLFGAVFCLFFPFLGGAIQFISLELIPCINILLLMFMLLVAIPKKSGEGGF